MGLGKIPAILHEWDRKETSHISQTQREDWRTRHNLFSIDGKYGIFIWHWMKIVCHFWQHLTAVIWFGGNGKLTELYVNKAQMSESKADWQAPRFGVLRRTPFDLLFYWRIRFPPLSTSPGCDNLCARLRMLKRPGTPCLCVAGHKSPRVLSASLSSLAISGKASSLGTLPLWVLGSLWGVTGQSAEEATSCEM